MEYSAGKKSIWMMVLIYLGIALVVYAAIYYLFMMNKGGTPVPSINQETSTTQVTSVSSTDVIMVRTDMNKGSFMSDKKGMTLYVFDKDSTGVSNCYQACATLWPPFMVDKNLKTNQSDVTEVTRTDGSMQYAWMGKPLYYYSKDKSVGDITGDGINGVWHLVKP